MTLARLFVLVAASLWLGAAQAIPLEQWRVELEKTRLLAENDVPAAYRAIARIERELPRDATAVDRVALLNLMALIESYLALTSDSIANARQALALAKWHNDRAGQAEADLILAAGALNQGRVDDMIAATIHSVAVLEGVERPDLIAKTMLRTAMMYRRIGAFDASVTLPMQAMEIAEHSDRPLARTYAHHGMAISMERSGDRNEALTHYRRMAEAARAAQSRILEAQATLGIASAISDTGRPREAEAGLRAAAATFREAGAPFHLGDALLSLAGNLRQQGRQADALDVLDEVVAIFERGDSKIGLWRAFSGRADVNHDIRRPAAANADAERARAIADEVGLALHKGKSAEQLARLAAARGDHARAYGLLTTATQLSAKATQEWTSTRILEIAQHFKAESRQREIDDLTRSNERQALHQRWLWTILVGSIALLAVTAFLQLRLRSSHRLLAAANAGLQAAQDELQALNAGLEQRVQARTAELRQQARYLRTLIDMLPMWAWFKDDRNRYLVTNQAHAAARGLEAEEMIGRSDLELAPHGISSQRDADDDAVMATRERRTVEEQVPDGSGNRWMETYKAAVVDEDGTIIGMVGVARDISERKAAEAARDAALEEASRLAQLRSDFIAQMSHELRTPLNGILGYVQLLGHGEPLDEHQRSCVDVIQQSGEQLLTLINDILDLAKIEAGKLDAHVQDVDLHRFLGTVADVVRARAEQKGLRLSCDLAADLPEAIRVDERLLRQVLLNLLSNAVKFTERGQVSLQVFRVQSDRLRFSVADTGAGIETARIEAIFHPFEQGGEARQGFGGTGLGLAIARQFVRRMGGEVHVDSRAGEGSRFWFDIEVPASPTGKPASAPVPAVRGHGGPRRKALVIDDLTEARELLVEMLAPLGFELAEAADGHAGLELAQSFRPDLFLIDAVMPGMDGYEMTRRLRKTPGFERVPIIGISASALDHDRENFRAVGVDAFLAKPLSRGDLLASVGALLGIEWEREERAPAVPAAPLLSPPASELKALHAAALQGSMRDIASHAAGIAALGVPYRPFADRLRQLAAGYQSKAILALVEQHLEHQGTQ